MSQGRLRNRCIKIVDDEAREEGFAWMQQRYEPVKDSKWQALSIDLCSLEVEANGPRKKTMIKIRSNNDFMNLIEKRLPFDAESQV